MFKIHQSIWWEYPAIFWKPSAYGFAQAKVTKVIFDSIIWNFVDDTGNILKDFESWFYFWVEFIWLENLKIPGLQPSYKHKFFFQDMVSGIGGYFEFLLWSRKKYMYNLVFT